MSNEDINRLNLLSTLHYIAGAITALLLCIPLFHIARGLFMGAQPLSEWEWPFLLVEAIFFVLGFNMAGCIMLAGWKLKRRKNRLFCIAVAGMECVLLPFGVLLARLSQLDPFHNYFKGGQSEKGQ